MVWDRELCWRDIERALALVGNKMLSVSMWHSPWQPGNTWRSCNPRPCAAHPPCSSRTQRSRRTDCCCSRWLAGRYRWGTFGSRWCGWGTAGESVYTGRSPPCLADGASAWTYQSHPAGLWADKDPGGGTLLSRQYVDLIAWRNELYVVSKKININEIRWAIRCGCGSLYLFRVAVFLTRLSWYLWRAAFPPKPRKVDT